MIVYRDVLIKYLKSVIFVTFISLTTAAGLFAEPIPFSLKRGIPEIEVTINDSIKSIFAIDTGADQIYIDKAFAVRHGLLSGGRMPVRPVAGIVEKSEAFQIFLRRFQAGEVIQNNVAAVVLDLQAVVKDTSSGLPDGVAGYSFLKSRRLLLDYVALTVEFSLDDSALTETKSAQIPFALNRHLIVVDAEINDSVEAKMILDTGASYSLLSPALAKKLNLKSSSEVSKIKLAGRVTTANVKILVRDLSTLADLVKNAEIAGVLGTSYLLGRRLIIDYPNNQLTIFANK